MDTEGRNAGAAIDEAEKAARIFPKNWGAEFIREGEVRFRLWAPGVETLSLRLGGTDTPMEPAGGGWFELLAEGVAPGARYGFVLPGGEAVPDPASRFQPEGVGGLSAIVDPTAYDWRETGWPGRPWEEAVIYEMHVGTFTPEGTFAAAAKMLPRLAGLGVTAVELMPVGEFPGTRGWGYDGVLPYAPHHAYGRPEDMKAFVDAAHGLGLMVLLDVVYNHFGPLGNHLARYAPAFFAPGKHTPWGAAIDFGEGAVHDFFIDNAVYWLSEYNLDGLRLDAIHAIEDEASPHLLEEMARRIEAECTGRRRHVTAEDSLNRVRFLRRDGGGPAVRAAWNDDLHHALHAAVTGETGGVYRDFAENTLPKLARALAEGFAMPDKDGGGKDASSAHLPPAAFIAFLQNHDQIGNRARGERLHRLVGPERTRALTALLLLSPQIPLLFMGAEYGADTPFLFFCDYRGDLAEAVRKGHLEESEKFGGLPDEAERDKLPDPSDAATFEACKLEPAALETQTARGWLAFHRDLLALRRKHIVPLLKGAEGHEGRVLAAKDGVLAVDWRFGNALLQLRANLSGGERILPPVEGDILFSSFGDGGEKTAVPFGVTFALKPD